MRAGYRVAAGLDGRRSASLARRSIGSRVCWDTAGQMQAAFPADDTEARAAMSLTRDYTAENGEIIDER